MHNSIYFDIKYDLFGVKGQWPILEQMKLAEEYYALQFHKKLKLCTIAFKTVYESIQHLSIQPSTFVCNNF